MIGRPLAALLLSLAAPALLAGESGARLQVSATVLPRASAVQVGGEAELTLTAADVQSGAKEITAVYEVRSNTRRGYALAFAQGSALAESVEVLIAGTSATLNGEPVAISFMDPAPRSTVAVRFFLRLRAGLEPGRYALPVTVQAEPI